MTAHFQGITSVRMRVILTEINKINNIFRILRILRFLGDAGVT